MAVPVSPGELLRHYLRDNVDTTLVNPENVVYGPLAHTQQQEGGVSLMDAGMPEPSAGFPLISVRTQIRVLAPTNSQADLIGRHVWDLLNDKYRVIMRQPSTDREYLVHAMTISAGPSQHWDSDATWEDLLFVNMMIGTIPLGGN